MKLFDYSKMIRVIDNIEIREAKEKAMEELNLKERYNELERSLIESGVLDDWNRLKWLCAKANVRLCVSHIGNDSIGYVLGVGDFRYCNEYNDNGAIVKQMSGGSHWSDNFGFTYEADKGIIWKIYHSTNTHMFTYFKTAEEAYRTRIQLLESFRDTYENYREFQLMKIEQKFANRIKVEDIIK